MRGIVNTEKRLNLLIKSAKARKIIVDLNIEVYKDIMDGNCSYCNIPLKDQKGYCLDRFDNRIGYTTHNVVGCCKVCNYAKRTMTCDEFYEWIERAYNCKKEKEEQIKNTPKEILSSIQKTFKKMKEEYMNQKRIKKSKILRINPLTSL